MIVVNAMGNILDSEVIRCKEYLDEFISLSHQIKEKTKSLDLKVNFSFKIETTVDVCNEKWYKISKIEIKKFDGQLPSIFHSGVNLKRSMRIKN